MICLIGVIIPVGGIGLIIFFSGIPNDNPISVLHNILFMLTPVFGFILMLYVMVRLSFMTVIALAEGRVSVPYAWHLSKGWTATMFVTFLVIWGVSALVPLALQLGGQGVVRGAFSGVTTIVYAITTLIYYAVIVTAYKKAAQDQPPVSLAVESF